MKATIETITPEIAEKYLRGNTMNRDVRERTVEKYARDIAAGRWEENGQTIVFNGRKLIDGQHRLLACIKAGVPFRSIVVHGVSVDAQKTIDTGVGRSLGDTFRFAGEKNANNLAGAVICSWRWEKGILNRGVTPTRSEAVSWLEENPEIRRAVEIVLPARVKPLTWSTSITAPLVFFVSRAEGEDVAIDFFEAVHTGAGLDIGNPALTLRNRLIANTTDITKLPWSLIFFFTVKAWNAWALGQPLERLMWNKHKGEKFPPLLARDGSEILESPS